MAGKTKFQARNREIHSNFDKIIKESTISTSRQIEEKIAVSAAFKVMEHGGFKFASM